MRGRKRSGPERLTKYIVKMSVEAPAEITNIRPAVGWGLNNMFKIRLICAYDGENLGWHQIYPIATCNWKKTTRCEACRRRGAVKFCGWTHTNIVNSKPDNGVGQGDAAQICEVARLEISGFEFVGGTNQVTFVHPMVAESKTHGQSEPFVLRETAIPEEVVGSLTFKDLPRKNFTIENIKVEYELDR